MRIGLAPIVLAITMSYVSASYAMNWNDLWLRPDQQGARALAKDQPQQAAKLFHSPSWQGVANYRAGDYQRAAQDFSKRDTAQAYYNRGNAFARLKQYEQAIAAYDQALKQQPNFADAQFNRVLVEKLLQQQRRQQKHQQQKQQRQKEHHNPSHQQNAKSGASHQNSHPKQQSKLNAANQAKPNPGSGSQKPSSQQNRPQAGRQNQTNRPQSAPQSAQGRSPSANQNRQAAGQQSKQNQPQQAQGSTGESVQAASHEAKERANLAQSANTKLSPKQNQALQQWLRQIPDDPGGLLRQKFLRDYQRRQQQGRSW